MTLRPAVRLLLATVLGLPLLQITFWWIAGLLSAMGDAAAAQVVRHLSTAVGVIWLVSLVGLVIALAVGSLDEPPPSSRA